MTMPSHDRCELCGTGHENQIHCWHLDFYDEDDAPSDEMIGEPYGGCRHCPATAECCPDCDGDGVVNYSDPDDNDVEADCEICLGWGFINPAFPANPGKS